ncbi:MAG TPA: hypothetical protein VMV92_39985 [Streptosporangiaceae bacterium]|nr:hypothetical protein [Streptosporangiaceae bacterium]
MAASIPRGSIGQQIREALKGGATAEQATGKVLGPYGAALAAAGNDSLVGYARPAVLSEARRLARQMIRKAEDRAFGSPLGTEGRLRLAALVFHLPDGTAVSWADSGREHHEARVAWLRTYIGSLETDLERHERAAKLLAEYGADRLGDIDGWEDLIGLDPDEDDEDSASASDGAAA